MEALFITIKYPRVKSSRDYTPAIPFISADWFKRRTHAKKPAAPRIPAIQYEFLPPTQTKAKK